MKSIKHENDVFSNYYSCHGYTLQRINKETEELGNNRSSGDNPNYYITEIGQNTEKSLGDLRRLAVTRAPGKGHLLMLM